MSVTYTIDAFLPEDLTGDSTTSALHGYFKALSANSTYAVMLGGSLQTTPLNQQVLIGLHPRHVLDLRNQKLAHWHHGALQKIQFQTAGELFQYLREQSWSQRAFLFAGYEFHRYCDDALWSLQSNQSNDADLLLIDFQDVGRYDLQTQTWHWTCASDEQATHYLNAWEKITSLKPKAHLVQNSKLNALPEAYVESFQASLSETAFAQRVESILKHIRQGDIYQANLSMSLEKNIKIQCPYQLYEILCDKNPSPFSAFLKTPDAFIISNSPERLLKAKFDSINAGVQLETRPIAGTRGRNENSELDQAIADTLLSNPKERAEHLMLVDLLRNDLGKTSKAGSVDVSELLIIERYSHVMHLVSNVLGALDQTRYDFWDTLRAVFPGGTITGCPKVRCIQILNVLEPVARGFYTGSLGYLNLTPDKPWGEALADWNILIRTLRLDRNSVAETSLPYNGNQDTYSARLHVGAGIVADSNAAHEYKECHRKAQALLGALYTCEHAYADR